MIKVWTVAMVHADYIEVYSHTTNGQGTLWSEQRLDISDMPTWYRFTEQSHAFQAVQDQVIEVAATQDAGPPHGFAFQVFTERLWVLTTEFDDPAPAELVRTGQHTLFNYATGEGEYPSDYDPNL